MLTCLEGLAARARAMAADDAGATAIEYGLIAGLIALAIVFALTQIGTSLEDIFQAVIDGLPPL